MNRDATQIKIPSRPSGPALAKNLALKDLASLINQLTVYRKDPASWFFFHIKIPAHAKMGVGEVMQILEQGLQQNAPAYLRLDDRKEVLVVCSTQSAKSFSVTENEISQALIAAQLQLQANVLSEKGVEQLGKTLAPLIPEGDLAAQIALKRFARLSNTIMVLDDDAVIQRVLAHMLQAHGNVETFSTAKDFLPAYHRFAPNIVFLDIHLQGERGTDIASLLSGKADPGAHIVMISADTIKNTVLESKFKGAKGFIGKPINADLLMRHVQASPLMYQRH